MNCLFCAAKSAPQAKFCSECGSPLSLQICPTCAAVNEKTESTCLTCGHIFARPYEPDEDITVPRIDSRDNFALQHEPDNAGTAPQTASGYIFARQHEPDNAVTVPQTASGYIFARQHE